MLRTRSFLEIGMIMAYFSHLAFSSKLNVVTTIMAQRMQHVMT